MPKDMEVINKIAQEVNEAVKKLGSCEICKNAYSDYAGKCKGYHWDISFYGGNWQFSLQCHTHEVWHKIIDGDVVDILLKALKGLYNGEWKNK